MQLPPAYQRRSLRNFCQPCRLRQCRWHESSKPLPERGDQNPGPTLAAPCCTAAVDKALREVAGTLTALYEPITDQAVAERLRACGPWIKAVLRKMLPPPAVTALPPGPTLCGHRRHDGASPRRHRDRLSPPHQLGPGRLRVSGGVSQRCGFRRNTEELYAGTRRCGGDGPRLLSSGWYQGCAQQRRAADGAT